MVQAPQVPKVTASVGGADRRAAGGARAGELLAARGRASCRTPASGCTSGPGVRPMPWAPDRARAARLSGVTVGGKAPAEKRSRCREVPWQGLA